MSPISLHQKLSRIAGKPHENDYMAEISAEGRIKRHFHYWLGFSGKRYLHTVFDAKEAPQYANAVIMLIKADATGRTPLFLAKTGKIPQAVFASDDFTGAVRRGGNELHVHLMGRDELDIRNIESDLSYLLRPPLLACLDLAA